MAVSVLKKLEISFMKRLGGPEKSRLVALRRREGLSKAKASCSLLLGRLRVEEDILEEHLQRALSLLASRKPRLSPNYTGEKSLHFRCQQYTELHASAANLISPLPAI